MFNRSVNHAICSEQYLSIILLNLFLLRKYPENTLKAVVLIFICDNIKEVLKSLNQILYRKPL